MLYDDDSELPEEAYSVAMQMLISGAMPILIPRDGDIYVTALIPADELGVESMLHPDENERLRFIVTATRHIGQQLEAVGS